MRLIVMCAALLAAAPLPAQGVAGTWSFTNPQGGRVVLKIDSAGGTKVSGMLSGNGNTFTLEGQLVAGGVMGTLRGNTGSAVMAAAIQGGLLLVQLKEVGPNGLPNPATTIQLPFTRDATARVGDAAAAGQHGASGASGATGAGGGAPAASPAASPADQQLTRLLLSSAWCSFSYSGSSTYSGTSGGTTRTSRVAFQADGLVQITSGSETTNSGSAGSVVGNNSGGQVMRWRVQNGALLLSADGAQWQTVRLDVQRNSNGYPIVKADDTEYMQCR